MGRDVVAVLPIDTMLGYAEACDAEVTPIELDADPVLPRPTIAVTAEDVMWSDGDVDD